MVDVVYAWINVFLVATGLSVDPLFLEPDPNYRGATEQQAPIADTPTTTARKRARTDGFEGDIYNGF